MTSRSVRLRKFSISASVRSSRSFISACSRSSEVDGLGSPAAAGPVAAADVSGCPAASSSARAVSPVMSHPIRLAVPRISGRGGQKSSARREPDLHPDRPDGGLDDLLIPEFPGTPGRPHPPSSLLTTFAVIPPWARFGHSSAVSARSRRARRRFAGGLAQGETMNDEPDSENSLLSEPMKIRTPSACSARSSRSMTSVLVSRSANSEPHALQIVERGQVFQHPRLAAHDQLAAGTAAPAREPRLDGRRVSVSSSACRGVGARRRSRPAPPPRAAADAGVEIIGRLD